VGDITRRLQPWPVDRAIETLAIGALTASREGLGRKARDRIAHFLRAAIDNDNTKSVGRSLGSFFAFLDDGGRERVQATGPLDVRDNLEATKPVAFSSPTLKQHMAPIRMLFDHLVTGGVLQHNPAPSVKAAAPEARREQDPTTGVGRRNGSTISTLGRWCAGRHRHPGVQ
jgi:hypothetical protein